MQDVTYQSDICCLKQLIQNLVVCAIFKVLNVTTIVHSLPIKYFLKLKIKFNGFLSPYNVQYVTVYTISKILNNVKFKTSFSKPLGIILKTFPFYKSKLL